MPLVLEARSLNHKTIRKSQTTCVILYSIGVWTHVHVTTVYSSIYPRVYSVCPADRYKCRSAQGCVRTRSARERPVLRTVG